MIRIVLQKLDKYAPKPIVFLIFGLYLTLPFSSSKAGLTPEVMTEYRWQSTSIPGKKLSGKCYEIDIETAGEKYLSAVLNSNCKPPKDQLDYAWIANDGRPGGKCYQVDKETKGEQYVAYANWKKCSPENSEYILSEGKCYIVGNYQGSPFINAVSYDLCKSDKISYQFQLNESGSKGSCYEIDQVNQVSKRTSLKDCKPKGENSTQFIWNEQLKECFEVALEGPATYISSAQKADCRPKEVKYQWIQEDNPHCLEVGTTPQGQIFQNRVNDKKCLESIKTQFIFIKTNFIAGKCYEIDSQTMGKQIQKSANMSRCREQAQEIQTKVVNLNGRDYCIEFDQKNPSTGYRRSIGKDKCTIMTSEFKWEVSSENPFEGKCLKLTLYNGDENWNPTLTDNCRTKKTRYFWYTPENYPKKWIEKQRKYKSITQNLEDVLSNKDNLVFFGKCYEIDDEKGPLLYSNQVNIKYCKEIETTLKYFHPRQHIESGCYIVDNKTQGFKYLRKTLDENCKNEFLKTKNQLIKENMDYSPN